MAAPEHEMQFVAQFWRAASDPKGETAFRVMSSVAVEAIDDEGMRKAYEIVRLRFAGGFPTEPMALMPEFDRAGLDPDLINDLGLLYDLTSDQLEFYAGEVVSAYRRRRFVDLLRNCTMWLENGKGHHGGRKLAEELAFRLLTLFSDADADGRPQNVQEIIAAELQAVDDEDTPGISLPWRRLETGCLGPLIPGDVLGISAYSNGGKSTLAANLARIWARKQTPVLVFPTEMREQWLRRAWAAEAWVPSYIAERRQWRKKGKAADLEVYKAIVEESRDWCWEVVNRSNVSPAEILGSTRVLRKRWSGQTVVVIVDHMHRLDYSGEDPNEAVGAATRSIKNFAMDDRDGGLIFVLLYQPRKPSVDVYRPIAGHEIRGNSMVWNELDVHISPFRSYVKVDVSRTTTWNTPGIEESHCAIIDRSGRPVLTKKGDDTKLNDEHVLINVDKRRVGGEGPMVALDFHKPSGAIYQKSGEREE